MPLSDNEAQHLVNEALRYATEKHEGQFRRNSPEPYIFHPVRVASAVDGAEAKAAALLHDVVEDCYPRSPEGLAAGLTEVRERFGDVVADVVDAMTQRKYDGERSRTGEQYFDYVRRIAENPMAVAIKLADIADNSRTLPEGDTLLKRYAKAKQILNGEIE